MSALNNHANLIWGIAELLRGDYKQSEYGRVILPLVVMRRLDQALEQTKQAVLDKVADLERRGIGNMERPLRGAAGLQFFNKSPLSFPQLLNDPGQIAINLRIYLDGFSTLAHEVFDNFGFDTQIERLDRSNLLYPVISRICDVDLHPDRIDPEDMGAIFEELIRKFAEQSNETAGEHFTPREVVRLMVDLLLAGDDRALTDRAPIRTVYDCACGTGGMLSEAYRHITALNSAADVRLYGQELNGESYAICLADILVKNQDASRIAHGNTLSEDQHRGERFHYGIANPPFGVDWSKVERPVRDEHALGDDGRFAAGLPRKSDGQLLFLLNLVAKMREVEKDGGRVAIVLNGSPLFTGAAGSGESEIRRYLIENDLLEGIVALPEQLFYNTGIATYVWVLTNRKSAEREGNVQLVDARELWVKMRKSLGDKRREISAEQIEEINRLYGAFEENNRVKILPNEAFGYRTMVVEQPLRARWEIGPDTWVDVAQDKRMDKFYSESDQRAVCAVLAQMPHVFFAAETEAAEAIKAALLTTLPKVPAPLLKALVARTLVRDPNAAGARDSKGRPVADPGLRTTENVPLTEDVREYLERRVWSHLADAYVLDSEGTVGYTIPFVQAFNRSVSPDEPARDITEIAECLHAALGQLAASRERLNGLASELTSDDWPEVPLKYVAKTGSGHTPSRSRPDYWVAEELETPWFTLADIGQVRDGRKVVVTETSERLSRVGIANSAATEHPAGTVFLSRTASVGFVGVMGVPMAVSQDFMTWTCGPRLDPFFLAFALRARRLELLRLMYGSTHKTIYMPDLLALSIRLPPLEEQERIVGAVQEWFDHTWALVDAAADLGAAAAMAGTQTAMALLDGTAVEASFDPATA